MHVYCYVCTSCRVANLIVDPVNVAIPTSLIGRNSEGELIFTFYIQLSDSFLSKEDLQLAVQVHIAVS